MSSDANEQSNGVKKMRFGYVGRYGDGHYLQLCHSIGEWMSSGQDVLYPVFEDTVGIQVWVGQVRSVIG